MNCDFITVVARIKAKQGKESYVQGELLKLIEPTRAESGCVNYDCHESTTEAGLFLFYENWKTERDVDQHLQTAHVQNAFQKLADSLETPPELTFWNMISKLSPQSFNSQR